MPGGTVHKNESRTDAVHRVVTKELCKVVAVDDCLWTCKHPYETAAVDGVESKHYLATGYRCYFESNNSEIGGDDQHRKFRVFGRRSRISVRTSPGISATESPPLKLSDNTNVLGCSISKST